MMEGTERQHLLPTAINSEQSEEEGSQEQDKKGEEFKVSDKAFFLVQLSSLVADVSQFGLYMAYFISDIKHWENSTDTAAQDFFAFFNSLLCAAVLLSIGFVVASFWLTWRSKIEASLNLRRANVGVAIVCFGLAVVQIIIDAFFVAPLWRPPVDWTNLDSDFAILICSAVVLLNSRILFEKARVLHRSTQTQSSTA